MSEGRVQTQITILSSFSLLNGSASLYFAAVAGDRISSSQI